MALYEIVDLATSLLTTVAVTMGGLCAVVLDVDQPQCGLRAPHDVFGQIVIRHSNRGKHSLLQDPLDCHQHVTSCRCHNGWLGCGGGRCCCDIQILRSHKKIKNKALYETRSNVVCWQLFV